MTIGLFLDVDNTLTKGFIQHYYAKMVCVEEEYKQLEESYESDRITSEQFGDSMIKLFNQTQFSKDYAAERWHEIKLKEHAEPLLQSQSSTIKIYLVSSGPSYYVKKLAQKYEIPEEHTLCSEYVFGENGKLRQCHAVTPNRKFAFRSERARGHDLTIGVGDDELHDSFLHACDIGLLIPKSGGDGRKLSDNHFWAPRLSLVLDLVRKLDKRMSKMRSQLANAGGQQSTAALDGP